ncbi:MAG: metal-sensing transcriptional repressor [Tissierellia bacterium]|nr:metal-sensing transcriptional repressor [Tissierellia bacterium]
MNEGKKKALRKLKIARGQIDGIIKMIEDERYCVDISTQILAIIAQLKKANIDILNSHLHTCVVNAIRSDDEDEAEEKIQEIVSILDKYIK